MTSETEAPWHAGLRSARANLGPGLALQAFALAVVLGYYFHEPTRVWFNSLAHLREEIGIGFGIISTGLFGGMLPLLYLKASPSTRDLLPWRQGGVIIAFWSYKGLKIGLWYALVAWSLGEETDVRTIALKSVLDQFVYCPLIAIPFTALIYF